MNRTLVVVIVIAAIAAGLVYGRRTSDKPAPAATPEPDRKSVV